MRRVEVKESSQKIASPFLCCESSLGVFKTESCTSVGTLAKMVNGRGVRRWYEMRDYFGAQWETVWRLVILANLLRISLTLTLLTQSKIVNKEANMYIQIKENQEKSFKSQPWNCSKNVLQQFHEQQNEWKFVFSTWAYITLHFYICSNFENNGIFKLPEISFHVWGRKWFLFQMPLFIMWRFYYLDNSRITYVCFPW